MVVAENPGLKLWAATSRPGRRRTAGGCWRRSACCNVDGRRTNGGEDRPNGWVEEQGGWVLPRRGGAERSLEAGIVADDLLYPGVRSRPFVGSCLRAGAIRPLPNRPRWRRSGGSAVLHRLCAAVHAADRLGAAVGESSRPVARRVRSGDSSRSVGPGRSGRSRVRGRAPDRERVGARRRGAELEILDGPPVGGNNLGTLNGLEPTGAYSCPGCGTTRTGIASYSFAGAREREQAAYGSSAAGRHDRLLAPGGVQEAGRCFILRSPWRSSTSRRLRKWCLLRRRAGQRRRGDRGRHRSDPVRRHRAGDPEQLRRRLDG